MIMEVLLFSSLFHHKPKPQQHSAEWFVQRQYLARAVKGIQAYEDDVLYLQYEHVPMDAFEAQFQKAWEEKDGPEDQFIEDMRALDKLGQVLDSTDRELHRENVI